MADITYQFNCEDGSEHRYTVTLSDGSEPLPPEEELADWTKLEFEQCEGCRWDKTDRCPVAVKLMGPAKAMSEMRSFDNVDVSVTTPDRTYSKGSTAQEALGSLFGLVMAQSGCPTFEPFKGLAWFHLPFANRQETLFRLASSYLLRQFMAGEEPRHEDGMMLDIQGIYADINHTNRGITQRLLKGLEPESNSMLNAIIILDSNSSVVSYSVEQGFKELRERFV